MVYRRDSQRQKFATASNKRKREGWQPAPLVQPDLARTAADKKLAGTSGFGDQASGTSRPKRPNFYYKEEQVAWHRELARDKKTRQLSRAKALRTKETALWAYDEDIFEIYSPPQLPLAAAAAGSSQSSAFKAASTGLQAKLRIVPDCILASPCSEATVTPILAKHAGINAHLRNFSAPISWPVPGESVSDKLRHLEHNNPWSILADLDDSPAIPFGLDASDSAPYLHASTMFPHQSTIPSPSHRGTKNHAAPAPPYPLNSHKAHFLPDDKAGPEHAIAPLTSAISVSPRPVPTPPLRAPHQPPHSPVCNAPNPQAPHTPPPPKAQTRSEEQSSGRALAPRQAWLNRLGGFCSQPCVLRGLAAGTGLMLAGMMSRRQ